MRIVQLQAQDHLNAWRQPRVALAYGPLYYGCVGGNQDRFFFNVISSVVTSAARYLGRPEVGEGQVAANIPLITTLRAKRRDKRRSSRANTLEHYQTIKYRQGVLDRTDRIEILTFQVFRQYLPNYYSTNGVAWNQNLIDEVETLIGDFPMAVELRP